MPEISPTVTGGLDSVAIRCPAHEIFRKVLELIDIPLAAPSANPFGYLSPTSAEHVRKTLGDSVNLIIDGGKCSVGIESTILDMTASTPKIVRPGKISASDISNVLDMVVRDYDTAANSNSIPGQSKEHYSPNTHLILFKNISDVAELIEGAEPAKLAFVFLKRPEHFSGENIFWLSDDGNHLAAASALFNTLQTLDCSGYDAIYCQCAGSNGIGSAINDRLSRAAAKFSTIHPDMR
jgi:L-threonylcarbamoyladenylate synthase